MRGRPRKGPPGATSEAAPTYGTTPQASGDRFAEASREARKLAAAILEVLAGAQAPGDASRALGISLPRYYQLEMRALGGLVAACEDRRRKGRGLARGGEVTSLRRECEQLRRECNRQQALVRAARRAVGLDAPPQSDPKPQDGRQRRKRRPTARALKMAALLQPEADNTADCASATANIQEGTLETGPAPTSCSER
jgi:hypothetical protein